MIRQTKETTVAIAGSGPVRQRYLSAVLRLPISYTSVCAHDTTRHGRESASRPRWEVGAAFAPRRLPVARILAWRHARQLLDCHLESSAILSQPCPKVLAVGCSPRRRQHAVCNLPLAPCARVAMPRRSCRSPEAHTQAQTCTSASEASRPSANCRPKHRLAGHVASSVVRASNGMGTVQRCSPIRLQDDQRHCTRRVGGRDV